MHIRQSRTALTLFRHGLIIASCAALLACGGIPLRSLPRLAQLSNEMLTANPAEFTVALQVDARLAPPADASPRLLLKLSPKVAGTFEPVDKRLPLKLTSSNSSMAGLGAPDAGRRWLVYSLPPSTQAELERIQNTVRQAQAQPGYQRGGSLSMGVEQGELAVNDPALAATRWSTWVQVKQSEGFFEVWTGTLADVLRTAEKAR